MQRENLPLFSWQPACKLIVFPMASRVGRIRDVAEKMLDKQTQRHAEHYYKQVTEALVKQLKRVGLSDNEVDEQTRVFWEKVDQEIARLCMSFADDHPGGAA